MQHAMQHGVPLDEHMAARRLRSRALLPRELALTSRGMKEAANRGAPTSARVSQSRLQCPVSSGGDRGLVF
jgi:hypothetical protein